MAAARCLECGAESEDDGHGRAVITHRPKCPQQTDHERIKQLEEELRHIRYSVKHVLGELG